MSMESHGEIMRLREENSRALAVVLAESSSSEAGGTWRRNVEFCLRSISYTLVGFFNIP
jgi:hypothetical protein